MDEEAEDGVWDDLADEAGDEEEVVVVDPDEVTWAVDGGDALCKGCVCGFVVGVVV